VYETQHKKRDGGVAQVMQHLPRKLKALSSNPSTIKQKQKHSVTVSYLYQVQSCSYLRANYMPGTAQIPQRIHCGSDETQGLQSNSFWNTGNEGMWERG
jgi:hypothetical protein